MPQATIDRLIINPPMRSQWRERVDPEVFCYTPTEVGTRGRDNEIIAQALKAGRWT